MEMLFPSQNSFTRLKLLPKTATTVFYQNEMSVIYEALYDFREFTFVWKTRVLKEQPLTLNLIVH